MKKLSDYMPKKNKPDKVFVQARVDAELRRRVELKLKKEDKYWSDLITAALTAYLEEKK